jgi:ABC-2 type transport system ATP-binding protein
VRDLIRELRRRGTTVFLNSHLLGEVEATCDRVVFLKNGRTVRELTLADAPAGLDVELRVGAIDTALEGLAQFGDGIRFEDDRLRLRVGDVERLPQIAAYLVNRGVPLYGMQAVRPSLETVFLEVMGDDGRPG